MSSDISNFSSNVAASVRRSMVDKEPLLIMIKPLSEVDKEGFLVVNTEDYSYMLKGFSDEEADNLYIANLLDAVAHEFRSRTYGE